MYVYAVPVIGLHLLLAGELANTTGACKRMAKDVIMSHTAKYAMPYG